MNKTIEKRLERIEKQLETEQETILVPDFINDSGQLIEVPKNFFCELLQLLD